MSEGHDMSAEEFFMHPQPEDLIRVVLLVRCAQCGSRRSALLVAVENDEAPDPTVQEIINAAYWGPRIQQQRPRRGECHCASTPELPALTDLRAEVAKARAKGLGRLWERSPVTIRL